MAHRIQPHGYLRRVLAPDEEIIFLERQHPLFLFGRIFWWLLATLAVVAVVGAMQLGSANPALMPLYGFVLIPLIGWWWQHLVWSNHMYVMTDRRVMQLSGVLNKEVVDSLIDKLNDVKTDQSLLGRMFGYGDIEILTANEGGNNVFRHIGRPLEFKRALLEAKDMLHENGTRD
jgi:uncharacterized membrane protein YdbT with pleckstrin-like domain